MANSTLASGTTSAEEIARSLQRSEFRRFVRQALKHRLFMAGLVITLGLIVVAIFAPTFAPWDPFEADFTQMLASASRVHPLGTDYLGRDLLSRVIFGGRFSLLIALSSMTLSALIGFILGILAGYLRGKVDTLIMAFIDMMFAIPGLLLGLTVSVLLGPSAQNLVFVLAIMYAPILCRVTRGAVIAIAERPYIESARSIGASKPRIMLRHVLPNAAAPIIVQITIGLAWTILSEASMTFLGFGAQPPDPSWGAILANGRKYLTTHPAMSIWPGVAIAISVWGFNLLGDGLRDLLDPALRER
jgi:peptide/nickel transport system permease protein